MKKYYKLKFLDIERDLPITKTKSGIYIAGFNCVGDMEVLTKSAKDLVFKIKNENCDIILTTELKGLPIAQEVARLMGCDYVCLRKEPKCYLVGAKRTDGESITSGKNTYYVSEIDENKLTGKDVVFVDDVFSTGSTFESMLKFADNIGFNITCVASILREGIKEEVCFKYKDKNIYCSGYLPLPKEEEYENN